MANKYRGEVKIQLDRPRTLRFTNNSLAEFEDALGLGSYLEWFQEFQKRTTKAIGVKELRALLWSGLIHEDSELKISDVGPMMDVAGPRELHDDPVQQSLYVQEKVFAAFFYRVLPPDVAASMGRQMEEAKDEAKQKLEKTTGDLSVKVPANAASE